MVRTVEDLVRRPLLARSFTAGYRPPTSGSDALAEGEALIVVPDAVMCFGIGGGAFVVFPWGGGSAPGTGSSLLLDPVVADVGLAKGLPVAVSRATGRLILARADQYPSAFVVGLASDDTQQGFTNRPQRGTVTLANWMPVTGAAGLSPGLPYFLAPSGGLTPVPDRTVACVCRVGTALSPTTLVVDPSPPVLL